MSKELNYNLNIIDGLSAVLSGFFIFSMYKEKLEIRLIDVILLAILIRGVYSNIFM